MPRQLSIEPGDRFLVCRTDRLGDLILALPLISTLKARFPQSPIDVLASAYAAPILEGHAAINNVIPIDPNRLSDRRYYDELVELLTRNRYKLALAVYPDATIAQLLKDSAIPHRIGTAGRWHSLKYNHRLYHSRKGSTRHESEYDLDFLRFFADGPTVHLPLVKVTPVELATAKELLSTNRVDSPYAVLHPGSGGSADSWPIERFLELSDILRMNGKLVVVTGSESERQLMDSLLKSRGTSIISLAGQTDLRTLAALLSLATVVVANSTGPLHLAAAVGTRVVGLYPHKRVMAPIRWRPLGDGHRIVQPATSICRCSKGECQCMFSITAQTVAEQVEAIWAECAQRKPSL